MISWAFWVGVCVVGAVGGYLIAAAVNGSPLLLLGMILITAFVPVFGAWTWRRAGHEWVPILSWTVPVAIGMILMMFGRLPNPAWLIGYVGLVMVTIAMSYPGVTAWWYRVVLRGRTPPKSSSP